MAEVVDAEQRALALDYRTSFAVTAPAGSGKTELLIQRCLTLLARVEKPEEILAITFTRKAANEMRSRILAALVDGQCDEAPTKAHKLNTWSLARNVLQQDARFGWCLLDNPNRLRIQTIDSFCMYLVQRMPLLSRLGAEASISDDPKTQYQQAARNLLARLEGNTSISKDLQRLLKHLDNNTARIEELLCSILSKREQWLRHFGMARQTDFDFRYYLETCLIELVAEALNECGEALQLFESQLMLSIDFACNQLRELAPDADLLSCYGMTGLPERSAEALPQWRAISNLLLTKDGRFRASLTKNQGFPSSTKKDEKEVFKAAKSECMTLIADLSSIPGILEKIQEVRSLPYPEYSDTQWQFLDTLTRLLPTLVAELTLVFMEQGQLDYAQVSSAAAMALGDEEQPSDIALLLDYQLKHILVDEFQDTSTPQFNLLKRLTEGWEPNDGHTLFIVGDGMQSCYGFREANVGLFLAAREFGIGNAELEVLDLSANFRSDAGVVDWVNRSFSGAFPAQDNIARGAVAYSPSVAVQANCQSDPVAFFACVEEDGRQLEAAKVVELVQEINTSNPEDSIAILVRNRSHLSDIIPALRDASIEWRAVDIDPLEQRPLISDLMALTKALLNPADRIAWLSVLRAPWCGLSLADLHKLTSRRSEEKDQLPTIWRQLSDQRLINSLSESGKAVVERLMAQLDLAIGQRHRKPINQWLEGLWLALGGHLTAASSLELAQVSAFFELLIRHEKGGTITDLNAFQEAVSRLYAKPSSNPDIRLQIMTIHKSKGLEFDHVILPGLDKGNASRNQELLLWHERLSGSGKPLLLMGSLPPKGAVNDDLFEYLKREHRLKEQLENTRLLYVGATRAVKQLRLIANVTRRDGCDELKSPSENSLLSSLWPQIKSQAQIIESSVLSAPQAKSRVNRVSRLPVNWQMAELPLGQLLAAYRGHEYQGNEQLDVEVNAELELSLTVGKGLKNVMMAICQRGSEYWQNAGTANLSSLVANQMSLMGKQQDPSCMHKVVSKLQTILNEPKARWLLSVGHDHAKTNWQLSQRVTTNGVTEIQRHQITRSFVADGVRWIVDFDCHSPCVDDETLAQKRQQLMPIVMMVSQLDELSIKAAIYFAGTETPILIELL